MAFHLTREQRRANARKAAAKRKAEGKSGFHMTREQRSAAARKAAAKRKAEGKSGFHLTHEQRVAAAKKAAATRKAHPHHHAKHHKKKPEAPADQHSVVGRRTSTHRGISHHTSRGRSRSIFGSRRRH